MKIKKANKSDIEKVLLLSRDFIEEHRKATKMKAKVSVDEALKFKKGILEKTLASSTGAIFVVIEDEQFVGYIFVLTFAPGMVKAPQYSPGYISDLHIEKDYRKRGFAMKLVKKAEEWCREKGKKEIALDVDSLNLGAIKLYQKMKFAEKFIKFEKKL